MGDMKKSKRMTVLVSVCLAVWILSTAIAAPILIRPFYYLHIQSLDLPDISGKETAQIKEAYNEIVDYCIGLSDQFSAGNFPFSQEGAQHFQDVRYLFQLDLGLLGLSAVMLGLIWLVCKKRRVSPYRFFGFGPLFWAAASLLTVFAVVSVLACLNFNTAFTVFHKLFFPGKDNWMFSYKTDPIIQVLPQVFFRNCALLILGVVVVLCVVLLCIDLKKRKRA